MTIEDKRKSMKVDAHVKEQLQAIRGSLDLKSESEALAYLIEVFREKRDMVSVRRHFEIITKIRHDHNQLSL